MEKENYWGLLSKIWNFVNTDTKELWESFWDGMNKVEASMENELDNISSSITPETANIDTVEYDYDFQFDIINSEPLYLDPTSTDYDSEFMSLGVKLVTPHTEDGEVSRRDLIEVSGEVYRQIRDVSIGKYAVIDGSYFKIINTYSSEEPNGEFESAIFESSNTGRIMITASDYNPIGWIKFLLSESSSVDGVEISEYNDPDTGLFIGYKVLANEGTTIGDIEDEAAATSTDMRGLVIKAVTDRDMLVDMQPKYTRFDEDGIMIKQMSYYRKSNTANGRWTPPMRPLSPQSLYNGSTDGQLYYLQVDGDLVRFDGFKPSLFLVSGLTYKVPDNVLSIPGLSLTPSSDYEYYSNVHYIVNDGYITFNKEYVEDKTVLYCNRVELLNTDLSNMYGNLVNLGDINAFNFTNKTLRASVSGAMKSIRSDDYNTALNVQYDMPIAVESGIVTGLYESWGYYILNNDGRNVSIYVKSSLSPMFNVGMEMITDTLEKCTVASITGNILTMEETLSSGTKLFIKLSNKLRLLEVGDNQVIIDGNRSQRNQIQHVIDMMIDGNYPEINIYEAGSSNGVYHITGTSYDNGEITLNLWNVEDNRGLNGEIKYNDYIESVGRVSYGIVHIQWPTHKFILINSDMSFLDTGVDTILDTGDHVNKYDVLTRNTSVVNNRDLPGWNQYNNFKKYNNLDAESSIVELTGLIVGAKAGTWLPKAYTVYAENDLQFYFNSSDITSLWQAKLTPNHTYEYVSEHTGSDKMFDVYTSMSDPDEDCRQSCVMARLVSLPGKKIATHDKADMHIVDLHAHYDYTEKTFVIIKDGNWDENLLSTAVSNNILYFKYDHTKSIVSAYVNKTHYMGLSGSSNIVNNIRYSGVHVAVE